MPTIADILAEQEEEATTGTDLASIIATERDPSEPIGDPVANRQAVADGHLTGTDPATAIDGLPVITDFEKQDPLFSESRRVGAAAVDNYLASLTPAERNAIPGSEHLDSDFPDFPGLEEVQAPFAPRDGRVVPTLGGRPEATLPTRLNELGLTREFFANIPEMVKQTFKQQAGGITLAAGEQLKQDLSWRSRLGRLAGAVAGPLAGVEETTDIFPGLVRVSKELGDWATDAIAQGFGVDSSLVEGGQQLRDEAMARIRDLQPAEKTFMQEVITSGTQSAALALPGMAVSMITRNPTALLAAFGASTYGDSYGTARDAGKSPGEAHRFALIDAGIEVGTEIGPAKIMLGASKTTIRKTLTRLFKSEMGGETAATIGQKVNSAMSGVDTMPLDQWLGELWEELKVTWATTAILTPLQGATARLAGRAIMKVSGVQDITGELQEITPEEQAAVSQKATRAGKALKAAMFTTAGVAETDLDLSDEQIQRFIDQPELSDIAEADLDAIIGDEANEQRLISDLVDRVSGIEPVIGEDDIPAAIGAREEISEVEALLEANDQAISATPESLVQKRQENAELRKSESTADFSRQDEFDSWYNETPLASRLGISYDGIGLGGVDFFTVQRGLLAGVTKALPRDAEGNFDSQAFAETVGEIVEQNRSQIELAARMGQVMPKFERWAYSDEFLAELDQEISDAEPITGRVEREIQPTEGRPGAIDEADLRRRERAARDEGRFPGVLGERREEQRLEPFSPEQIESVPLREAVESGLISEDEGVVIDGFLESLPEPLRESFDVVFSGQEFEPTEAQLKAHDIKSAKGFAVRGALLEKIKNEARDTIVMFGGSDVTTFFHEFGELAYKRLLTSEERKYVASLKSEAGAKVAPNEWFSDQLQTFIVQEKEEVFKPKLQKILDRVANAIRTIWERIRSYHRTPALDEIFNDILAGQRALQPGGIIVGDVVHEMPDGSIMAGEEHAGAVEGSQRLATENDVSTVSASVAAKTRIREITGQVEADDPLVRESVALKASFTKAAQAARAADRAGNKEGVAKEKARMKAILESAKERKQAQERRAEALTKIKKELKATKVKKVAGKPVGKFTAETQEIFDTLRADLKLTKVQAFNKIAQNLEDNKDNIPPYSVAIENRLLSVIAAQDAGIGRLGFARIQQQGLENILTEIKGLKGVGLTAREAQQAGRLAAIHDTREKVIEIVGGIPEGINAVGEEGVTLKGMAGIKQGIRNALIAGRTNSVVGWKDLLDILSFHDRQTKPGESEISRFGDVLDANNAEKQGNINAMSAIRGMTFETYGLESDSDMVKKFTQDAVIHDLGEFKTQNDVFVKLRMTRAEARKRAMEIMDPTLHDTLFTPEGMGWTQEMADAVFDFLTPQDEEFITKQLEFYQEYYESINDVYKVIYGVNLPKNINYSPIAREGISQDVESTLGEFFNEISLRASAETAGGLKARVSSKLPLRPQSDISVIQQHVAEMEHFKAWSEKIRDLNAVFGNSQVRQAIRVNFGERIDRDIQRFIIDMARGGTDTSMRMATLDRMMGRYARSVLAVKPSIFLKQLTSTIAYADSVPAAYWTKEVLKFHEIPKAIDMFFDEETGSTLVKSRWEKGEIERDINNAMKSSEFARLRAKPSFLNAMMFNVKLGDMGAIIVGGYPIYKYHRSQGLSHEEALKRFESVTESTQQSADISQQSSWQRGGSFAKLFTMFMSSPNQYLRKELSAIRNLAAGRITAPQFAKTMLIYHIALPMFFQLASDRFVWSEDEDEEALFPSISGEQKRAMILGSLNGFFIVGDALEAVVSKALDLKIFGFENPMWSIVNDALKAWPLLGWDDIDPEDFIIALRALAGATGAVTGLPGKQAVDIVTGFNETLSGEYETGIAQMMGWSPHQAERAAERSEE